MVDQYFYHSKNQKLTQWAMVPFVVFILCLWTIPKLSMNWPQRLVQDKARMLFIPPISYIKMFSGTFKGFIADMFYIRGLLVISDKYDTHLNKVDWVQKNFGMALSLDPKLTEGYFFAGVVLSKDEETLRKGIAFMKKYRKANPTEWRIPYWIGFNYYQLGDYLEATKFYEIASRLPGGKPFLMSNQPMLFYKAGRADLGVIYLEGISRAIKDERQLEWIEKKLLWLKNIHILETEINKFKQVNGRIPVNLKALVNAGNIREIPKDTFGQGFYLDQDTGFVKSHFGRSSGSVKNNMKE